MRIVNGIRLTGWCLLGLSVCSRAEVRLPAVFSSHMVIQRDQVNPMWGWASPEETVTFSIPGQKPVSVQADAKGNWRLDMPSMPAGGPFDITVAGTNTITLADVYMGEVWLCSGQSNMEMTVSNSLNAEGEKAAAQYPLIRHIRVPKAPAGGPNPDIKPCEWQVCSPDTVPGFSAAAYFFGREIHRELQVPVGLINSSWGGTRIEPWTPPEGFAQVPALKDIYDKLMLKDPASDNYKQVLGQHLEKVTAWLTAARNAAAKQESVLPPPPFPPEITPYSSHQDPATLYNGMIHGLVPFGIRGILWYQGESNRADGMLYYEKMRALIAGWRTLWHRSDLPFYFVQIAPYQYGNEDPYVLPGLWEAQAKAATLPGVGMAVINDIGNLKDIHPKNKQEVGRRLALIALAGTYGRDSLVWMGPTYRSMAIEGNRIRIRFDGVGSGLASRDGQPLTGFEVIGEETDFVPAQAVIDGDSVVVSAPEVSAPLAVRFAWNKLAEPNLMNREGLPAGAFRAGDVPERDYLALRVGEAKTYTLVYDLNLAKLGREVTYDVDNHSSITGPFDRVAYFLELQKPGESLKYVYVSMDAFTAEIAKVGLPTLSSKANFQTKVNRMNVVSNVEGIVTGGDIATGNIEFWPNNYGPRNSKGIPDASADLWDFGDQSVDPVDGYGCMQIHNYGAKQTLLAVNQWKGGGNGADIGIGNSPGKAKEGNANAAKTRDWTFERNAGEYTVKRLRVLVRLK